MSHPFFATRSLRGRIALIAAIATAWSAMAYAVKDVWVSGVSGSWSVGSNWLDGTAPVSASDLILRFSPIDGKAVTATNNQFPFAVNRLRFQNSGRGTVTLSGSTIFLSGPSAAIEIQDSGNAIISTQLNFGGTAAIVGVGSGDLTISGGMSGASVLLAAQAPSFRTQLITLSGSNTLTAGVTLQSGNLVLASPNVLGSGPLTVNGGSLRFGTANLSINRPISLNSDLLVTVANNSTIQSVISNATSGAGLTLRTNTTNPTLTLSGASTYDGATRIDFGLTSFRPFEDAGTLRLTGANGSVLNSSLIDIRSNGTLQIDPVSGGLANRIADSTPVQLRSGRLSLFTTSGFVGQSETVGDLSVGGHSVVTVVSPTSATARFTANSLSRIEFGTVLFRGTNLGETSGFNRANVHFTNAPSSLDLVGGDGSGLETSILPYAIGDVSADGLGTGFVTYGLATGVRLLDAATEYATSLPTESPTHNLRLVSNVTNTGTARVNSLLLAGGSIGGNGELRVSSGAVLVTADATVENVLDFGSTDGKIFTIGNLTLASPIAGRSGLTKSGDGTLTLTSVGASFIGPITINAGSIAFRDALQLGFEVSPITFNGQSAGINYTGASDLDFSRGLTLSSGIAKVESTGGGSFRLSGTITGPGGLQIDTANGSEIQITGNNTFSGPVWVFGGADVRIDSDAALGTGSLVVGGTIRLAGPWITSREIKVLAGGIDTAGFDAEWNGPLTARGSSTSDTQAVFEKKGEGTFTLNGPFDYLGKILVSGGEMIFNGTDDAAQYTVGEDGTLSGNGRTTGPVDVEGILAPGDGVGELSTGSLTFLDGSTFEVELTSSALFDSIDVTGSVSLADPVKFVLGVAPGFDPSEGTRFTIIQNDGTDAILLNPDGRFVYQDNVLEEGELFIAGESSFQISYIGGSGNDVTLEVVPEPGLGCLLVVGAMGLLSRRRQRR